MTSHLRHDTGGSSLGGLAILDEEGGRDNPSVTFAPTEASFDSHQRNNLNNNSSHSNNQSNNIPLTIDAPDLSRASSNEAKAEFRHSFQNHPSSEAAATMDDISAIPSTHLLRSILLSQGIHHRMNQEGSMRDIKIHHHRKQTIKGKITKVGVLCLAGTGMFVEAYIIITTGQIKSIWHSQYPECWSPRKNAHCPELIQCCGLFPNTPTLNTQTDGLSCAIDTTNNNNCLSDGTHAPHLLCPSSITRSVSYTEFAGIMAGMLFFGAICDRIGRKNTGTLTSILMIVGVIAMTYANSSDATARVLLFSIFFGIFGLGVGGEYPLTASTAVAQHAQSQDEALEDDSASHHSRIMDETVKTAKRGETIAIVFAMQGVGAVVGSFFLLSLIYFSEQSLIDCDKPSNTAHGNDASALNGVWRSFYLTGAVFVLLLLLYRWLVLEEGDNHTKVRERKKQRELKLGKVSTSTWKILKFYAPRLIGTGGNWFVWDMAFYGLKLFSGPIFDQINPEGDLIINNGWLLFNNLCALLGYYAAASVIDGTRFGRRRLQIFSFTMNTVLFMTAAAIFDSSPPQLLMFLYFASSFFGNFGANVTTYVMAAETYPTELRGTCHGISAFMGKAGALTATIAFSGKSAKTIFWICGVLSLVGSIFTFLFSVDLTLVSLTEHDVQLELFLEGRPHRYEGKLNAKEHLSVWEKWTGRHGTYNPTWAAEMVLEENTRHSRALSIVDFDKTSRSAHISEVFDEGRSKPS